MTVAIKVNPIQICPFQDSQKLRVEKGFKIAYVGVREMRLEKKNWKRLKNIKIKHQFIQISLTSTIIIGNF